MRESNIIEKTFNTLDKSVKYLLLTLSIYSLESVGFICHLVSVARSCLAKLSFKNHQSPSCCLHLDPFQNIPLFAEAATGGVL